MESAPERGKTHDRGKLPTHKEIETAAYYHWKDRMELGILGDAISDWFWADNLLQPRQ